ncbi:HNH endonuclease signature motif containing protein [Kocuria dechangensis]|uniref:HNH endonuclease signature motif containing protein n=1 Tax=Kocuria dechangensis TaxID=1176249 RepID=UPI001663F986|nr:HNH endonuclease signature motif containing protein [Kocuria dechangensis]
MTELVEAARAEARAAGAQYRLIHRMWGLAEEAREQRWAVEAAWLRRGADRVGAGTLEPEEQTLQDVADEIGPALALPAVTARARVREAVVLGKDLPQVLAALENGHVGVAQARVIVGLWLELAEDAASLPAAQRPEPRAVQRVVEELLDRAPQLTGAQLRGLARRRRAGLTAAHADARHRAALADRRVWVEPLADGMALLGAILDAATATAVHDRLTSLAERTDPTRTGPSGAHGADPVVDHALPGGDFSRGDSSGSDFCTTDFCTTDFCSTDSCSTDFSGGDFSAGDFSAGDATDGVLLGRAGSGAGTTRGDCAPVPRTLGQRRADVLADLLLDGEPEHWPERLRGIRGQVTVTVPALALLAHGLPSPAPDSARAGTDPGGLLESLVRDPGCAQLGGYGPIPVALAARIAARAPSWARVLTDPVTAVVTDHDRTRYTVPADLKHRLRLRDGTCRFPGCRRRAERCDLDHTVAWAHGGRTAADNLAHLCRHHHLLKHRTGPLGRWQLEHHRPPDPPVGASTAGAATTGTSTTGATTTGASTTGTSTPGGVMTGTTSGRAPRPAAEGVLVWTSPAGRTYRTHPDGHRHPDHHDDQDPPPF